MFYIPIIFIKSKSLHLSVHRHNFERRSRGGLAKVPGFVRVVFPQHLAESSNINKVVVVKVTPPSGKQTKLRLFTSNHNRASGGQTTFFYDV